MTEVICTFSHQLAGWRTIDEQTRCPNFQQKVVLVMQWRKTYLPSIALCSSSASFSRAASSSFAFFSAFLSVFLFSWVAAEGLVFALSFAASFLALSAGFSAGWKTNRSVKEHKKRKKTNKQKTATCTTNHIYLLLLLGLFFPFTWVKQKKTNKQTKLMSRKRAYTSDIS